MFKEEFKTPIYDDAPFLSDQLLLPHLATGRDVHLAADFVPSYVFQLVNDLAKSKEVEPGFLNLVFFVRGNLGLKVDGINQFKHLLTRFESEVSVARFVLSCLSLIEEGGLRITLVYSQSNRRLIKGSYGLIVQPGDEDYVSFVDSKAGDFNSPVKLYRSWEPDDIFVSQEILEKISTLGSGGKSGSQLVDPLEVATWLTYLDDWYEENPPISVTTGSMDPDDEEEEEEDSFQEFLSGFDELRHDDKYDWISPNDEEEFEISVFSDYGVVVDPGDSVGGHIPPLPFPLSQFIGPAPATCVCGNRFSRADGCDEVSWD